VRTEALSGKNMYRILLYSAIFSILPGFLFAHENYQWQCRVIAEKNYGLNNISINIDGQEVLRQIVDFGTELSLSEAFAKALGSFMEDSSDIESPLALSEYFCEPSGLEKKSCARDKLKNFMNNPRTKMALVPVNSLRYMPERGETQSDYWIFYLLIPDLSDHIFWALVKRDTGDVYNYGFN
jgi:hypothetical protein